MYLAINDMQAIRSVIDTLRIPSLETRVSVMFCGSYRSIIHGFWTGSHIRYVF